MTAGGESPSPFSWSAEEPAYKGSIYQGEGSFFTVEGNSALFYRAVKLSFLSWELSPGRPEIALFYRDKEFREAGSHPLFYRVVKLPAEIGPFSSLSGRKNRPRALEILNYWPLQNRAKPSENSTRSPFFISSENSSPGQR